MKFIKQVPFYPIFFCTYPILALMAHNLGEFELREGWRPLILSIIVCALLWGLLRFIVGDWRKSALVTSMFTGLFFLYGHVYNLLKPVKLGGFYIGRHRYLLPLMVFLVLLGTYWVIKKSKDAINLTATLNWVSLVLIVLPAYQIASYGITSGQINAEQGENVAPLSTPAGEQDQFRDIYYIILDAYTRQDTLLDMYGYDNSEFIQSLSDLGFYVAECSQSNYPRTYYSLLSSLNMEYRFDLGEVKRNKYPTTLLVNNNVRGFLGNHGYVTVAFETGFPWDEFKNADYYLSFRDSEKWLGGVSSIGVVTDLEMMLLETTLAKAVWDVKLFDNQFSAEALTYWKKRAMVLYDFEMLKDVHNIAEPKFVFAHIVSPHLPFIFGPHGEEIVPEEDPPDVVAYAKGYTDQVTFLNGQVLSTVKEIIQESDRPPIIIIQGDHGPSKSYGTSSEYRSTILNAYYLPDGGDRLLYPDISPVNTFRVVLNYYFDQNLDLLDDVHYDTEAPEFPAVYPIVDNVGPVCGN